ncbi:TIGR01777 family oxidoreductase [Niveibacterium terrae]|uniref:TIGR01777 family oxidoreductase n=1 Tax=Niveibacterium terrae TaxID=3373598 RepID=UPI003A8E2B37
MDILLTGGTGLIGRALCARLLKSGHRLTVLSRHPERVATLCGDGVRALGSLKDWRSEQRFDAIINLAGAPIIDLPWSTGRQRTLWRSRITLTEELVEAIARADSKPEVLLSGSAIGYYGDSLDSPCSDSPGPAPCSPGTDFSARLCAAWEEAALAAETLGVRVCLLRTGLVLSRAGGLYARMRRPFSLGLGARLGDGQQWMSWIHIEDHLAAVELLLGDASLRGAFNLTAPTPVRNEIFTRLLAASLGRQARLIAPAAAIRLALGRRAFMLLGGQRILPNRLLDVGFAFRYPDLASALKELA